jgi:pyridoxal phosphate enzyme (YggS family)
MEETIHDRYRKTKKQIANACEKAGRDPSEILLVAVSKLKPDEDIRSLLQDEQVHFGENRAKALEDRMEAIPDESIQWHFIGNLQTNKIKYMAHRVNWIQSVHKKKALKEIEKRASNENRTLNTLIQVNISEEDQKSGCHPDDLEPLLRYAQSLKHTKVKGLMGMATFTDDFEIVRPEFRLLKQLRDEHLHLNDGAVQLEHLSMGMTNDFEIAIEEGATILRIGTAIFGERNY